MIDLLLDNPIIIGFVIYFVWMMLKPSKAENKKTPNRPVSPPRRAEVDEYPPYYEKSDETKIEPKVERKIEQPSERKTLTTNSTEHEARKKVTLTQSNASDAVGYDYAKEKQRLEERKKKAEEALKRLNANTSTATTSRASSSRQQSIKPNKQQLREGILWAEILNKPKAKRQSIK